jgi:hypothetical protein
MSWNQLYSPLHRALADGTSDAFPRPLNGGLESACASWGALHYALGCLLGWADVGRGLAKWYAAGKPTADSAVLTLVKEVWGADDLLDYYAAWAWKPRDAGWLLPQTADPFNGPSPAWLAEHSMWPVEDWWRAFIRRGFHHHHDPFYGGTDSLHLSAHTGREDQEPSRDPIIHWDTKGWRCVLVSAGLKHWLADLDSLTPTLPSSGEHSWHVEVFDRKTGWLGMYRRSRVTGGWFNGKHSIHMLGAAG